MSALLKVVVQQMTNALHSLRVAHVEWQWIEWIHTQ